MFNYLNVITLIVAILGFLLYSQRNENNFWHSLTTPKHKIEPIRSVEILTDVINFYNEALTVNEEKNEIKFAIGVNTCLDLIVPASAVLNGLKKERKDWEENLGPKSHDILSTEKELFDTFAYFFQQGGAAERHVSSSALFDRLIDLAFDSPQQDTYIGGNAALISVALAQAGHELLLCGPIGPRLNDLLSEKNVNVAKSCLKMKDEVHLILEYTEGETFSHYTSPRANRFIVTHDISNSRLDSVNQFGIESKSFGSDLVVLSGLHMLEGQDKEFQDQSLINLQNEAKSLSDSKVHLELASMGSLDFCKRVAKAMFSLVDSIGLNEQELFFLETALLPDQTKRKTSEPSIPNVLDSLHLILNSFGKDDRLSRVHFHSLGFHILAIKKVKDKTKEIWIDNEQSLMNGILRGAKQACQDKIMPEYLELRFPLEFLLSNDDAKMTSFDSKRPLQIVDRGDFIFYLAPMLVCRKPINTVGLGDCITAGGLSKQGIKI